MKRALALGALLALGVWACFDFDGAQRQFCQDSFGSYADGRCVVGTPDGGAGGIGGGDGTGGGAGGGSGGGTGGGVGGGAGGGGGDPDAYDTFVATYSSMYCSLLMTCRTTNFTSRTECEIAHAAYYRESYPRSMFVPAATADCLESFNVPSQYACFLLDATPLACGLVHSGGAGVEGDSCSKGCSTAGPFGGGGCEAPLGATNDCQGKCALVTRCGDAGVCRSTEFCVNNQCVALDPDGGSCATGPCHPDFHCSPTTLTCTPRKGPDAGCGSTPECRIGLTCGTTPQYPNGVCHPWGEVGDGCKSSQDCRPGLSCLEYTQTCGYQRMVDAGAPCGNGLYCKDSMCRLADGGGFTSGGPGAGTCAKPQPGEICAGPEACGVGMTCGADGGGCRPAVMLTACSSALNCPVGGYCNFDQRRCYPRGSDGGACSPISGGSCEDGLECVPDGSPLGGSCRPPQLPGKGCTVSDECIQPASCLSGTCTSVGRLGEPCIGGICFTGACNRVTDGGPGTCGAPLPDQSPCALSLECASGYCDQAFKVCRAGTCP